MSNRLINKKTVKISFSDSPNEQDFDYTWDLNDLNLSSDEDILLKGKSEILWTRAKDVYDFQESYQSFSDLTGRTLSSCSWHNDEFDMKSTSKVNASLEAIDNALYEKLKSPVLSDSVFQECSDWAEKFPYLRIKGKQLAKSDHDNFVSSSTNSATTRPFEIGNLCSSLLLEGKKVPIHSVNKSKGASLINVSEVQGDESDLEEYLAVHNSDEPGSPLEAPLNDSSKNMQTLKLLQDKVLGRLVSEMWPSVITFLEKLGDKSPSTINDELQLPPIAVAQKRSICLKRPKTEGSTMTCTEFPKLESILTVSPKVLQKREFSRITRPSSEISLHTRMSSKSLKSIYHQTSSSINQANSEFYRHRYSRNARESENLCLVLPALEEDLQDSSGVLRGVHIEPGRKDAPNKYLQTYRSDYEAANTCKENEYFLPPIEDKSYVPSSVKLTQNLFKFYGSPIGQERNKYSGSARYKKTNSRPNTSLSKKTVKSNEVTLQDVNSGLYITAKGVNKAVSNSCYEKYAEVPLNNNEPVEESVEKSVTLFPIVTPLTPHEDKNSNAKKGLLHAFLGRKR